MFHDNNIFKMPKKIDPEVECKVRLLSELKWPPKKVVNEVNKNGNVISRRSYFNIVNNCGENRWAKANNQPIPKISRKPTVLTKGVVKKIEEEMSKENPPTQNSLAKRLGISQPNINRAIKRIEMAKRIKTRVHRIGRHHIQNRKINSRKLYENGLAGHRSEYAVTLDEAMIYMSNINGKRKICYVKKGESIPENWVYEKAENFSKGFMIVGAITGRGVLPLIRVPPKAKINSEYYIKYVLKRLLEKELPKLYPGELNKVFVHHDKASSHTSIKTSEYAADLKARTGISIIDNSLIPVKSPDASPLDFFGFGYLKQVIFTRRANIGWFMENL
jgi:DNA-binding Lrp family transcriptional regulator